MTEDWSLMGCKDRAGKSYAMLCLQILAEKLAEGLPIQHGVVVEQIDWGGAGVTLHCQGGEQVKADAVIVTVSLGVLKVDLLLQCHCATKPVCSIYLCKSSRTMVLIVLKLRLGSYCSPDIDETAPVTWCICCHAASGYLKQHFS